MKILATLLARDEEDILAAQLAHHQAMGVTDFIVTVNASSDRTRQIAENCPLVRTIIDESSDMFQQGAWVTRMARLACDYSPDWIIHMDADEFWCLPDFECLPKDHPFIRVRTIYHHFPTRGIPDGTFDPHAQRFFIPDYRATQPKIIHRPMPELKIHSGNHSCMLRGRTPEFHEPSAETVFVHHYPIRSLSQFRRKISNACRVIEAGSTNAGSHWRQWAIDAREVPLDVFYESYLRQTDELFDAARKSSTLLQWVPKIHSSANLETENQSNRIQLLNPTYD